MGWGNCGTDDDGRPIGYNFRATCDHPGCTVKIDRGLSHVCGGMHGGGEYGCGRYFCSEHLYFGAPEQLCPECMAKWEKEQEDDEQ